MTAQCEPQRPVYGMVMPIRGVITTLGSETHRRAPAATMPALVMSEPVVARPRQAQRNGTAGWSRSDHPAPAHPHPIPGSVPSVAIPSTGSRARSKMPAPSPSRSQLMFAQKYLP